jgi:hypothetical protein
MIFLRLWNGNWKESKSFDIFPFALQRWVIQRYCEISRQRISWFWEYSQFARQLPEQQFGSQLFRQILNFDRLEHNLKWVIVTCDSWLAFWPAVLCQDSIRRTTDREHHLFTIPLRTSRESGMTGTVDRFLTIIVFESYRIRYCVRCHQDEHNLVHV